jgi:hypothetical protein
MNLHTIKSFHEAALDQWNSLTIVLRDAVNAAAPAQRASTFLDAVCSLLELAGANPARRQNVLKGADVLLQPLFHESVTIPIKIVYIMLTDWMGRGTAFAVHATLE